MHHIREKSGKHPGMSEQSPLARGLLERLSTAKQSCDMLVCAPWATYQRSAPSNASPATGPTTAPAIHALLFSFLGSAVPMGNGEAEVDVVVRTVVDGLVVEDSSAIVNSKHRSVSTGIGALLYLMM